MLAAMLAAGSACAQSTDALSDPSGVAPASGEASASCDCIAAGTPVDLEILETLNSARHKRGDRFAMRLAAPLSVDGRTAIELHAPVAGEIVHAAPARGGGKPGELLIAARHVTHGEQRVALRGLKLGVSGQSNAELALAVSFAAGPFAMFIRGREIEIPAGTRVHAKLVADLPLESAAIAASTEPTDSTDVPSNQE
ncbi:hypothetical protein [Cognatilysobacter bugurensis]|uniref:hypothetical protein n=1 Tax=Cognatilysobacter bugurensis TaxID=543356 RepID=UPI001679A3B0|nr:hypothetical protein [Lysobacter bugurensis]